MWKGCSFVVKTKLLLLSQTGKSDTNIKVMKAAKLDIILDNI